MKELNTEDAKVNRQQSYEYYQKWTNVRTEDINFVIDYIISQGQSANTETVYKLVDTSKIGSIFYNKKD